MKEELIPVSGFFQYESFLIYDFWKKI